MSTPQPYIRPAPNTPSKLPGNLSLTQFIQTVFVGISGLSGDLVRPLWQVEPPEQPDISVNWMALGIQTLSPDAYAYVATNSLGVVGSQRHEVLEVTCHIYGPEALEVAGLIRDGFQITTNLSALYLANMGFVETSPARHVPDLINERYFNRILMSVILRREILRTYPVLTITSANGTIFVPDINADYMLPWGVSGEPLETQSGEMITTQSGEPIVATP